MIKPLKRQVGGDHYKNLAIQPIEYCQRNHLGAIESFVVKYVTRHDDKGGRKDIEKAIHLLQILLEIEYSDSSLVTEEDPDGERKERLMHLVEELDQNAERTQCRADESGAEGDERDCALNLGSSRAYHLAANKLRELITYLFVTNGS